MALVIADRVRETTTTSGTGTITLAGAYTGFQAFSVIGNGNTTYYAIVDAQTGSWEVGVGTYTLSGTTLSRDTVLSSSNSGSLVNFASGTKDVICTQPAERAVFLDSATNATIPGITLSGGTANGVAYLNGSKVLTSGSALTFDGTKLSLPTVLAIKGAQNSNLARIAMTRTDASYSINNETDLRFYGQTTDTESPANILHSMNTGGTFVWNNGSGFEQMRLTSSLLSVVPGATIEGLTVGRGAGAVSTNTAVGNVSLGNNTTGSGVTAVGYASLFSNTTGVNNTSVGSSTLQANTTGSYNTAFGHTALQANTTASNNTAVGYQAAYSNTTGASNVAIGLQALYSNTTGSYNVSVGGASLKNATAGSNTAVGHQSLFTNTTGTQNVAQGYLSLLSNTTGSYNVGIGSQALRSNTTASNNTAVGYQAAYSNVTGESVTALGYRAAYTNTASNTTAIGTNALLNSTTGDSLTAVGSAAMVSNTVGNYNTALGVAALYSNTTASNNTVVGYQAGYTNTTGGNLVAIGHQAFYANTTGASNTGVGVLSGWSNTTGAYNVAVGQQALYSNTTASYNTAVGYQAGYANQTGAENTFLGKSAGYAATGSSNTFVGVSAGYNSTGTNNTFVGAAGSVNGSGASMTTGSKNTILGGFSGNQGGLDIRTSSNNIVLSDGDGNPRAHWDAYGTMRMPASNAAVSRIGNGGIVNTGGNDNFFYIGKWVIAQNGQSNRIRITLLGTSGYGTGENGQTVINGTISNQDNISLVTYSNGNIYGSSGAQVAAKYVTDGYEIYVRTRQYSNNTPMVDVTGGYWYPSLSDTGSSSAPSGSVESAYYAAYAFGASGAQVIMNGNGVGLGGASASSGTGITFPATQNASTNPNTLDDYEEGTWSPVLLYGSAPVGVNEAKYIKIGQLVFCNIDVTLATQTNGNPCLISLPFAWNAAWSAGSFNFNSVSNTLCINGDAGYGAYVGFRSSPTSGNATVTDLSGARLIFTFSYRAN